MSKSKSILTKGRRTKRERQVEQELSDEQLEAVAGGASLGAVDIAPLEGGAGAEQTDPTALAAHCATGKHIPKVIFTR